MEDKKKMQKKKSNKPGTVTGVLAKPKKKIKLRFIILPAIAVILVGAIVWGVLAYMQGLYVAKIGNTQISKEVYTYFLNNYARQVESDQKITTSDAAKTFWGTASGAENYESLAKTTTMANVNNFQILLSEAKKTMTLSAADKKKVETYFNDIVKSLKTKEAAEKRIKEIYGVTYDQYKTFYADQLLENNYVQKLIKDLKITDADIKDYYEKNQKTLDKNTVAHILRKTVDDSNAALSKTAIAAAKKKADEILDMAKDGMNFTSLVKKYSQDTASVKDGGKFTLTSTDNYVQEFKDWSLDSKRKVGDLGVIKTQFGYHVMKFISRTPYSTLKSTVKSTLENSKLDALLTKLKAKAEYKFVENKPVVDKIKISIPTS